MKILAIETSCDETAISLVEVTKQGTTTVFKVLGNALASQASLHAKYGGVYPMMAKREHGKNLLPLFLAVLKEAGFLRKTKTKQHSNILQNVGMLLEREPELRKAFLKEMPKIEKPKIDRIAVTHGPGLEPTLWVGINFAKVLSLLWNIPIVPVNHMEGHILASFLKKKKDALELGSVKYPALALLVSGGHTELVLMQKQGTYEIVGETRDDAAGEAFDKAARMLSLPYPGGPEISKLAEKGEVNSSFRLPRPMLTADNFDFSFSGLKTALLYMLREKKKVTAKEKADIAREFEDAVTDVLVAKTMRALRRFKAKTVALGGGVSANKKLRTRLAEAVAGESSKISLYLPDHSLTTDNALMIATAGYFNKNAIKSPDTITARGNLSIASQ